MIVSPFLTEVGVAPWKRVNALVKLSGRLAVPERNINNFPVGGYKLAAWQV